MQTNSITTEFFVPGFQKLDWIQGTGTQYINTGFKYSQTTGKIDIKFRPTDLSGTWSSQRIGGSYTDNGRCFLLYVGSTAPRLGIGSITQEFGTIAQDSDYTLTATISTAGTCVYSLNNGSSSSFSYSGTIVNNYNYYIFCNNDGGTAGQFWKGKIYYFKLYQGTTLVRDFVPAMRKSDSVVGLIDMTNKVFYTNAGTGTFSYG